jgi:polysaccharide deacetylase 2 family uncharacterized protein YibQ
VFLPGIEKHSNSIDARTRRAVRLLLSLAFAGAILSAAIGCGKKPLPQTEVRKITRQMVFAAKIASDNRADVGMRPETLPRAVGKNAPPPGVTDHIYVTLPGGRNGQTDPAVLSAVQAALDRVASQHELQRQDLRGAPGRARFCYIFAGHVTQFVELISPLLARRGTLPARQGKTQGARLAIIIDDLGYDPSAADTLLSLPYPITVAVLPHLSHSADIAEEAFRRGYQVLLHLPMESAGDEKHENIELRVGTSSADAERLLAGMLDTVPHAAGVNNHQGSLATSDAKLMAALMPALKERDLFFVDSRTTAQTVACDAARDAQVRSVSRSVFLDDTQTLEAVKQQLARAVRDARAKGFAIAIGHPHPTTLQALQEFLPQLESHGVSLVFVSELVQ